MAAMQAALIAAALVVGVINAAADEVAAPVVTVEVVQDHEDGLYLCGEQASFAIRVLVEDVPGFCDHTGLLYDRASGWPRLIPAADDGTIAAMSGYYDAVNFARKFDGPAWVAVGLVDNTCRPTSIYSAYNSLGGEKTILVFPRMGHAVPRAYGANRMEWIAQHSGME